MGITTLETLDAVKDSRGADLQVGDLVFVDNVLYETHFIGIIRKLESRQVVTGLKWPLSENSEALKGGKTSNSMHHYRYLSTAYYFKLDGVDKNDLLTFFKTYSLKDRDMGNFGDLDYFIPANWKKNNNMKDTRKFPITDYLGRELRAGDLVIYASKRSCRRYDYGIVISQTHVMDLMGQKRRVHCVYKIVEKTQEEQQVYSELARKYKEMQTGSSVDTVKKNVGDVYTSGNKYYYVYLGRVTFNFVYFKESKINIEDKDVLGQEMWLKLSATPDNLNALKTQPIEAIIDMNIEKNLVIRDFKSFHGKYYYEIGQKLEDITIFTAKMVKSAKIIKVGTAYFKSNTYTKKFFLAEGVEFRAVFHDV